MQNMQKKKMQEICKICIYICRICKIVQVAYDANMQNMQNNMQAWNHMQNIQRKFLYEQYAQLSLPVLMTVGVPGGQEDFVVITPGGATVSLALVHARAPDPTGGRASDSDPLPGHVTATHYSRPVTGPSAVRVRETKI